MNENEIFSDRADDSDGEESEPFDGDSPLRGLTKMNFNTTSSVDDFTVDELVAGAKCKVDANDAAEVLERRQAGNQAKAALKELYDDDFDFDSPPESLDRYERVLTLRELEHAAISNGRRKHLLADQDGAQDIPDVEHAVHVVSIMETYGELAEHNLARVAGATVARSEVREAAAASLESVRGEAQSKSHDSLREALAAWLRPGDS